ncbi:MAG TPA: hypothetical protein PKM21_04150 [Anaerolineales bacterium]|nr:hypothetical protein [Anaerolineales bacterium]
MKTKTFTFELFLYLLAFVLALVLRLAQLGAAPLGDVEAGWALQALDLVRGQEFTFGPQPLYVLFTSQLFALLGSSNALARLLPALAGSSLPLLPLFLGRWISGSQRLRWAGLIFAFGMAIDPGLVALSRQAGSLVPALAFSFLAVALYAARRPVPAGILAGLALLSGPAVLHGALTLAAAFGLSHLLDKNLASIAAPAATGTGDADADLASNLPGEAPAEQAAAFDFSAHLLRPALLSAGVVLLLAGTLFLRVPQGLAALFGSLPGYISGWVQPSGISLLHLLAGLAFYQPLVLIFALIGLGRALFDLTTLPTNAQLGPRLALRLGLWVLAALILVLLYTARQVADLAWLLPPLWGLAAMELAQHLPPARDAANRRVAVGLACLLVVLAALSWISLLALARQPGTLLYAALIVGALLMGFVLTLLVGAGWSIPAARMGLVWAAATCLFLGSFSAAWGAAYLRPNGAQELWSPIPAAGQVQQMVSTLGDLAEWNSGHRQDIGVLVTVDSASLRWALRDFSNVRYVAGLAASESPGVVIAPRDQETPALAQAYRGQDFVWRVYPGWPGLLPSNLPAWLTSRQAPLASEQVVLWARVDLFPDQGLGQAAQPAELDELVVPADEEQIIP